MSADIKSGMGPSRLREIFYCDAETLIALDEQYVARLEDGTQHRR